MKVFGPIPSRRLGISLGINNIPYKECTYSCLYCQAGKTTKKIALRQPFYQPELLLEEVNQRINNISDISEYPDYLTIVPNGEPTLDVQLGDLIRKLKETGIKVAVITNASLIYFKSVQSDLFHADYISIKIDTVNPEIYFKINDPCRTIRLDDVLDGILSFSAHFKGQLVTETMLLKDYNDLTNEIEDTASFIQKVNPVKAYLSVPIRPPAFVSAKVVDEEKLNEAYQIYSNKIKTVELLTGYEGNNFTSTENPAEDILSITSVHPMRQEAIDELMKKYGSDGNCIQKLIQAQLIKRVSYRGNRYYIRNYTDKKLNDVFCEK